MNRSVCPLLFAGLLLALLAGCGPEQRPRIEGMVTYNGNPVADQTLTLHFDAPEGEFFTHKIRIKSDGTFAGDAPTVGKYKVVIERSMAAMEGNPADTEASIPNQYRAAATTDLVWEIVSGLNKRDFELKD